MKVHHLNAATLRPPSARLVNGRGGLFERARLVCHVLVVEGEHGLMLVDTGIGLQALADPSTWLGERFTRLNRPVLRAEETVHQQLNERGLSTEDVTDIAVTHLHRDHAGGLADFPNADIHVFAPEHEAATERGTDWERERYVPALFAHSPKWRRYPSDVAGQPWFGFDGTQPLQTHAGVDARLVPLPGHTRGHVGIAVRVATDRWLLHAGDAYFHHGEVCEPPRSTLGLKLFQRRMQEQQELRLRNQIRLRQLRAASGGLLQMVCSHDPAEFDDVATAASGSW